MGGCMNKSKIISIGLPAPSLLLYDTDGKLQILRRNSIDGQIIGRDKVRFALKPPVLLQSLPISVGNKVLWTSCCILPGQDPHNVYPKECQDLCFVASDENSLMLGLYDGHGPRGQEVARFCVNSTSTYFETRKAERSVRAKQADPLRFLVEATEKCDADIKRTTSLVDASQSGSTAVLLHLTQQGLHCASVGDSRAILATSAAGTYSPAPPAALGGEERRVLEVVKSRRSSFLKTPIYPVQLTKDQKPEDPEETARITKSGGTVSRVTDNHGNKIGPYRVWKKNVGYPGLAMSRSIGDQIASEIGIIATPVTTTHALNPGQDLFIVAASDGVWDVMDNQDVVNFVECYRGSCCKGAGAGSGVAMPESSSIARLLCEEARVRWFSIVEDEDVMIDDISCVIIEIEGSSSSIVSVRPHPIPNPNAADVHLSSEDHHSVQPDGRKDLRRGSLIGEAL
jgi:serine/threonine protein phosphatase PrpC